MITALAPRVLVLGIGNPGRGDDGAGPAAVHRLRGVAPEQARLLEHRGDGAGLLEIFRASEQVILIDAIRSGARPGTVVRMDACAGPLPLPLSAVSSHALGPAEAVEMARALGALPARLVVFGIEGREFGMQDRLSAEVEQALDEVVGWVMREIEALLVEPHPGAEAARRS